MASSVIGIQDATVVPLISGKTAPAVGDPFAMPPGSREYDIAWDALLAGAITAFVVNIEGSMDAAFTNPVVLDTYTGTTSKGQFITGKLMPFIRANITSLTGGGNALVRAYFRARGGR